MFLKTLVLFVFLMAPRLSQGFLVLQLNLEQLTNLSERIFVGECLKVTKGRDEEGRPVQEATFRVLETIKGEPEEEITFRQIRIVSPEERGGVTGGTAFTELPTYQVGENLVLFLSGESELNLTAPVGLSQGKFTIETTKGGKRVVTNGIQNLGLFRGMSESAVLRSQSLTSRESGLLTSPSKEVNYEAFLSLVRRLAAEVR